MAINREGKTLYAFEQLFEVGAVVNRSRREWACRAFGTREAAEAARHNANGETTLVVEVKPGEQMPHSLKSALLASPTMVTVARPAEQTSLAGLRLRRSLLADSAAVALDGPTFRNLHLQLQELDAEIAALED